MYIRAACGVRLMTTGHTMARIRAAVFAVNADDVHQKDGYAMGTGLVGRTGDVLPLCTVQS